MAVEERAPQKTGDDKRMNGRQLVKNNNNKGTERKK